MEFKQNMFNNDKKIIFSKSVVSDRTVTVPPINLMNVDTVGYLFGMFPYLIKVENYEQEHKSKS